MYSLLNQYIVSALMFSVHFGPTHGNLLCVSSLFGKPYKRYVLKNGASVYSNGASVAVKRSLILEKETPVFINGASVLTKQSIHVFCIH